MERRGRARRVRARVSFWEAFWEASVWMRLSCSVFSWLVWMGFIYEAWMMVERDGCCACLARP